jgi:hypothetical protein
MLHGDTTRSPFPVDVPSYFGATYKTTVPHKRQLKIHTIVQGHDYEATFSSHIGTPQSAAQPAAAQGEGWTRQHSSRTLSGRPNITFSFSNAGARQEFHTTDRDHSAHMTFFAFFRFFCFSFTLSGYTVFRYRSCTIARVPRMHAGSHFLLGSCRWVRFRTSLHLILTHFR